MDHSTRNENFVTCRGASQAVYHVTRFESSAYENNRVFNAVFLDDDIPTILLNAIAIITIQKTPLLRRKLCYFVILVQSSVDLGVGCFATPIMIMYLLSPFINVDVCLFFLLAKSTLFLLSGLSIITLSAMTMERYLSAFHPYVHRTLLTKKGIVTYNIVGALMLMAIVIVSIFSGNDVTRIAGTGILVMFLIFNTFAYTRIYLLIRKMVQENRERVTSNDMAWQENGRRVFGKTQHMLSCFIVVVSFTILFLPYILSPIFVQFENMMWNAYFWGAVSLVILNSSINSLIFFWKNKVLRREAIKFVKNLMNN
jgi:hypothetical protein